MGWKRNFQKSRLIQMCSSRCALRSVSRLYFVPRILEKRYFFFFLTNERLFSHYICIVTAQQPCNVMSEILNIYEKIAQKTELLNEISV